jgi:hypothetical protein
MNTEYVPLPPGERWYCEHHQRIATHTFRGEPHCDPRAGGIMLPCKCYPVVSDLRPLRFRSLEEYHRYSAGAMSMSMLAQPGTCEYDSAPYEVAVVARTR